VQHVEKNFMEVDYYIIVRNHVYYNMLSKKITLWGGGTMVDLIPQCEGEEIKSPHLQLGYFSYLGDPIR
jgi:hypothetical protein